MYQGNKGLPPGDTGRYTRAIGLRVGPAASFSVRGWRMLMSSNGALGVVGLTPFLHIRVVTEMFGDGSVFGTFFTVHDPGLYKPYVEVRSEEHTSELQSLMRISYAVFCLKKKKK